MDNKTIESSDDTTPADMDKCGNIEEDDKKEITEKNDDEGIIHKVFIEYEKEIN